MPHASRVSELPGSVFPGPLLSCRSGSLFKKQVLAGLQSRHGEVKPESQPTNHAAEDSRKRLRNPAFSTRMRFLPTTPSKTCLHANRNAPPSQPVTPPLLHQIIPRWRRQTQTRRHTQSDSASCLHIRPPVRHVGSSLVQASVSDFTRRKQWHKLWHNRTVPYHNALTAKLLRMAG
jgi:hypothetical protein